MIDKEKAKLNMKVQWAKFIVVLRRLYLEENKMAVVEGR